MSSKKYLIYFQDLGGSRYLESVLNEFVGVFNHSDTHFFFHKLSYSIKENLKSKFHESNFENNEIKDLTKQDWIKILKYKGITNVVCTLSSNYLDISNSELISASKELLIPTLSFMDHWKGFNRLYDNNGKLKFHTTLLGVIDETSKKILAEMGCNPDSIRIAGNLHLENLTKRKSNLIQLKPNSAVIISQPDNISKSFKSLFNLKIFKGVSLIEFLVSQNRIDIANFTYRPHPKEAKLLNNLISIDNLSYSNSLDISRVCIGINSMLLFENYLAGNPVIKLEFEEFRGYEVDPIPYSFGKSVSNLDDLLTQIENEFNNSRPIKPINFFANSIKSLEGIIEEFTSTNLQRII